MGLLFGCCFAASDAVAPGVGLLCSNYAAACATALSAFNCTMVVMSPCGNASVGALPTLDNVIGVVVYEPLTDLLRNAHRPTETRDLGRCHKAEHRFSYPVCVDLAGPAQMGCSPYPPSYTDVPNNASQVDFAASVGNICQTGLGWLGCPAGKSLVVPKSTETQPFQCRCGDGFDISNRAVENVIDFLTGPFFTVRELLVCMLCARDCGGLC